jgi:hypothetical protein
VPYRTDDEAFAAVRKFLAVNDIAIYERAGKLYEWDRQPESEALKAARALKDAWPSGGQLTYEQVCWWLQGVHWGQAPAHVREAIFEMVTFVKQSSVGQSMAAFSKASSVMRRSRESLFAYKRQSRASQQRVDKLWRAYVHRMAAAPVMSSARDTNTAYEITDWKQLDTQLDDQ